jgi:hypothetical protein
MESHRVLGKTDTVQKLKTCLTSFAESVSKKWVGIEIE